MQVLLHRRKIHARPQAPSRRANWIC